jgi:hypothetical protein
MPENFDQFWVVEFNGAKGWEVYSTYLSCFDAANSFRREVASTEEDSIDQWRLTSPKLV